MNILLIVSIIFVGCAFVLLFFLLRKRNSFGVLTGKRIYEDTEEKPGIVLYSTTIPLCGKPDYILEEKGMKIPVEVKTGKTPNSPYLNHTSQLMAYCLLVEENYHTRPLGGYLRYPDKEFKIAYTKEAEESVRSLVKEMMEKKENGEELFCPHPTHNI